MRIRSLFVAIAIAVVAAAFPAAACELEINLDCSGGSCRAETRNTGPSCGGLVYTGIFAESETSSVRFSNATTNGFLPQCFSSDDFQGGEDYFPFAFCFGERTLPAGVTFAMTAGVSGAAFDTALQGFTMVVNPATDDIIAMATTFDEILVPTCTPTLAAPGQVPSGIAYPVGWTEVSQPGAIYEVLEATDPGFTQNVVTRTTSSRTASFNHAVSATTNYYYKVRAVTCGNEAGTFSEIGRTTVVAALPPTSSEFEIVAPLGTNVPLRQQVFIPNPGGVISYSLSVDQPWLTVEPASGTISGNGATVTMTAQPGSLPVGATTATLSVTYTPAGKTAVSASTTSIPVSVTLVTPVASGGKSAPPANALVIPAVARVSGGAEFQSDVRLTNRNSAPVDYELLFTPSNANGLEQGKRTTLRLLSGQTVALDNIVKNFFGFAAPGDTVGGALEIRPLKTSGTLTFASSRTYATTPAGTLGQFIPAIPVANFIGTPIQLPNQPPPSGGVGTISLQQVAVNSTFRTNIGLVEGSGKPASGRIRVLRANGQLVKEEPFTLQPSEHQQFALGDKLQGTTLDDGRVEIVLDSDTGLVTGYASVIDNATADPFLVAPVQPATISSRRYVLPGVAALDNPGANFYSDIRLYNAGASTVSVQMRFHALPGLSGGGTTRSVSIPPGEVRAFDNVLVSEFALANTGGALVLDTPSDSSLVVTGRTFSRGATGTFGQFIPALTSAEGTALGERPLEILQVEQSGEFRSNIGLVELTGNPVSVRIRTTLPDSRVAAVVERTLAGNEVQQLNQFLRDLNVGQVYNGRISVEVIGGSGRIATYGSVVDNRTNDPTYVPGQ
ncbi:MAG: hypothetical protein ABR517_14680 [Thermoanaerobaculia bacterium]